MRAFLAPAVAFFLVLIPVFGWGQSPGEIEGRNADLVAALNRGDATAVRALYTEDAIILPAGGEIVRGAQLAPFWRAVLARIYRFQRTTLEVTPLGPGWAREIGTFRFTLKREMNETEGKYVVLWRQVDGAWQLATEIWNGDR